MCFVNLITCEKEAVFELEGHSKQVFQECIVVLRYPMTPECQYFLPTQSDSSSHFVLTGGIILREVISLNFEYQYLPLYIKKEHYRVIKENDKYFVVSDKKESLQNRYVQYIDSLDVTCNRLSYGYDTISNIKSESSTSGSDEKGVCLTE